MVRAAPVRSTCMCGLCGEITFDGSMADTTAVDRMIACLVPRGPDGQGSHAAGRVAFGHRRLSVIDLSPCGAQPMVDNELGLTAVFNGCIYDYRELRAELESHGYRFFSTSDTEVILKGYHHWGTDVVSHLHGMFAFVIHERDTGRVVMARDRLGIKPLYLAETPNRLRFASTLPALVRAGDVDTSVDPVALHHYLSWHAVVPAPRTILNGVRKLPPATVRVIEADGTSREHRYWEARYERRHEHANWSARDWEDAIEEALRVAVRRRLVADIPVGVLLSGGLDSSLIVGLLAEEGQTGLATYSIGFESVGGREGDEFAYSDVIAEHFATDHHRIRVTSDELSAALGHAIGAMAEPMVSHDVVAFDLLSERVNNMSMAWGLEARVPFLDHDLVGLAALCPPELKLADGGKGILKAIGRRIIPPEVIDRPKGYFPVPAITHLEGKVLDLVRDALTDDAARERGLFRPGYVDALLADPNGG